MLKQTILDINLMPPFISYWTGTDTPFLIAITSLKKKQRILSNIDELNVILNETIESVCFDNRNKMTFTLNNTIFMNGLLCGSHSDNLFDERVILGISNRESQALIKQLERKINNRFSSHLSGLLGP